MLWKIIFRSIFWKSESISIHFNPFSFAGLWLNYIYDYEYRSRRIIFIYLSTTSGNYTGFKFNSTTSSNILGSNSIFPRRSSCVLCFWIVLDRDLSRWLKRKIDSQLLAWEKQGRRRWWLWLHFWICAFVFRAGVTWVRQGHYRGSIKEQLHQFEPHERTLPHDWSYHYDRLRRRTCFSRVSAGTGVFLRRYSQYFIFVR